MSQNLTIKRLALEFTRQSDVTPYAAQDAVGPVTSGTTILAFSSVHGDDSPGYPLIKGGSYQVKNVRMVKSTSSTTNASFDVYLYTSGVTATFDNQPMALSYAHKHLRIGKTSFTLATAGAGSDCAELINSDVDMVFKAIDTTIYAKVVATAAYAPGASEKFYLVVELLRIND